MSRGAAWTALVTLAVGWALFLGYLARQEHLRASGARPDFVRYPYLESGSCRRCHAEAWESWAASPHAKALQSLEPRNLSAADKVATCLPCHAPEPILIVPGPVARDDRRSEGVSCVTCHLSAGGMAARRPVEGACRPVALPIVESVDLCLPCHNAHGTVDQWRASAWPARGVDCRSCHMPGSDHAMQGAHDTETLRRAVSLSGSWQDGRLVVQVANVGVGHNVPSGRRSRSLELVVDLPDRQERFRFRNPFRGEGGENTQLPSGATRRLSWPAARGSGTARVRLLFQFRPSQPDAAGVLLHDLQVPLGVAD